MGMMNVIFSTGLFNSIAVYIYSLVFLWIEVSFTDTTLFVE